jgi:hypothetical protein
MTQSINEEVAVVAVFDPNMSSKWPYKMRWNGRYFTFNKVDLEHPVWEGKTLHHIFSVCDGTTFFRLNLDTRSLRWTLEETSDGLAG